MGTPQQRVPTVCAIFPWRNCLCLPDTNPLCACGLLLCSIILTEADIGPRQALAHQQGIQVNFTLEANANDPAINIPIACFSCDVLTIDQVGQPAC